jgi:hypothetical protein
LTNTALPIQVPSVRKTTTAGLSDPDPTRISAIPTVIDWLESEVFVIRRRLGQVVSRC